MKKVIVYVFLFICILLVFFSVSFVNRYFSDRVSAYIQNKGVVYTQKYIQEAITNKVVEEIDIESMYLITENADKKITNVLIITAQVNKILALVNESLESNITKLGEEEIKLPISIILGETIFTKIGPDITLRILPIGKYECDVISNVSEYGINNSLFEIYINIKLNIETIIPLKRNQASVECKIPLVMQVVQGEVPRYYYNTDKLVPDVYENNQ